MIPMGWCGPVDHAQHRPKQSGDLEPNTSGLKSRCPDLQTRGSYCRHFQPANQSFSFFSIHAPICIWAAASITRISSSRTCRTAASTTRLSMVGRAAPCCHLYIACGVAKPKISCKSFTDNPACLRSLLIFCPVPVISMVADSPCLSPPVIKIQYPGGHAPYGVLWSGGPRLARTGTKCRPRTHDHSIKSQGCLLSLVLSHLS